jgi:conjugal transfer/entry exclusion protein
MKKLNDQIKEKLERIQNMIDENKSSEEIEKERQELDKYLLEYTQEVKEKKKK